MNRSPIWMPLGGYLIAACIFAAAWVFQTSTPLSTPRGIGLSLGGGLSLFVASGLIPLTLWAFFGFRRTGTNFVLGIWLLIGVLFAYFVFAGAKLDRNIAGSTNDGLVGIEKQNFFKTTNSDCQATQKGKMRSALGGTSEKIISYCDCYASGVTEAVTAGEMSQASSAGQWPASFKEKSKMLRRFCAAEIFESNVKF